MKVVGGAYCSTGTAETTPPGETLYSKDPSTNLLGGDTFLGGDTYLGGATLTGGIGTGRGEAGVAYASGDGDAMGIPTAGPGNAIDLPWALTARQLPAGTATVGTATAGKLIDGIPTAFETLPAGAVTPSVLVAVDARL
jgi:hypothetical protein